MTDSVRRAFGPVLALLLLAGLGAAPLFGQNLSGVEVMDRVFGVPSSPASVLTMSMVITKNGKSLSRSLTTWTTGNGAKGEVERTLMKFLSPADVKGAGFFTTKKPDGATESLLWLPALGRVRRLSSSDADQDQAFFGSDFTNRDINGFVQKDFDWTTKGYKDGIYTVEAVPRRALGYERLVYTVDSSNWKYLKIEYWRAGKLVKDQTVTYSPVGAYVMPSRIVMRAASGSTTELVFSDYKLDQKLDDQIFTERFLKQ